MNSEQLKNSLTEQIYTYQLTLTEIDELIEHLIVLMHKIENDEVSRGLDNNSDDEYEQSILY